LVAAVTAAVLTGVWYPAAAVGARGGRLWGEECWMLTRGALEGVE